MQNLFSSAQLSRLVLFVTLSHVGGAAKPLQTAALRA